MPSLAPTVTAAHTCTHHAGLSEITAAGHTVIVTDLCQHGIGELKAWRSLQRWTGRRDYLPETIAAIAGLVSDRTLATD